jgi:hypothetical protein
MIIRSTDYLLDWLTFLADDSVEVDVVAVAERSAVGGDAGSPVATRILVNARVHCARSNTLK